jgi:hypothetical protein
MSSLIVEVCEVADVVDHPNADRMAVAKIRGWDVCVAKNSDGTPWCKKGQKVVFFPPDSVIPQAVSDKHGVTKYLSKGRVRVANLRGFKSYGYLADLDDPSWPVGKDVAEHYGVTKYDPPMRTTQGDAAKPHPLFHTYYDMENIRNFPDVFQEGEEVYVTEKIHGENCRLGLIRDTNDKGEAVWKWMAGTHAVRRKRFYQKRDRETFEFVGPALTSSCWQCFNPEIMRMLLDVSKCGYTLEEFSKSEYADRPPAPSGNSVVLFGERFGMQDIKYGLTDGKFSFRAFDLTINGRYVDFEEKLSKFKAFGVLHVPFLWQGPYSFEKIVELTEGPSFLHNGQPFKEGVVVTAAVERSVVTSRKVMSRAQLKCISFAYLSRKDGTEGH